MINQLVFIMVDSDPHDSIARLLTYLEYRCNGAMWFPIPPGEWDLWNNSTGPETELGTAIRLLGDWKYEAKDVAKWLVILSRNYELDTSISAEDVKIYRRSL